MSKQNKPLTAALLHGIVIWQRAGVPMAEASEAIKKLGEAAAKVPFPDGEELRSIMLLAWLRDCGVFRFLHLEWWCLWLSR
jgi:hypothetical protein